MFFLSVKKNGTSFFSCAVKNAFADDQSITNYCRTIFMVSIIRFSCSHIYSLPLSHILLFDFFCLFLFPYITLSPALLHKHSGTHKKIHKKTTQIHTYILIHKLLYTKSHTYKQIHRRADVDTSKTPAQVSLGIRG